MSKSYNGPKILAYDVETSPIRADVWQLFDNNVSLNQVVEDWSIISWSAKWLHEPTSKIMYEDVRGQKNLRDDSKILIKIWKLLNEADIVLTQNGRRFDEKKLNARFIINGMRPPRFPRHIDTCLIAKKRFGFTSNKLEYLTEKLCKKYKKLKHKKFPGHEMWTECMKDNKAAWKEMQIYNEHDVLALEELYNVIAPWDNTINFSIYYEDGRNICSCGCEEFTKNGFAYSNAGKYQRYLCSNCGKMFRNSKNTLEIQKRKGMLKI